MVINYSACDNCRHRSMDHDHLGNRKCESGDCNCPGFKPQGS